MVTTTTMGSFTPTSHPQQPCRQRHQTRRRSTYGLPPLAAVFAWHLFLQRLAYRRHQDPALAEQHDVSTEQDATVLADDGQDQGSAEPREVVRALLAGETPQDRVTGPQVQAATGLSRSRAYTVLRELRAETPSRNGHAPGLGRDDASSDPDVAAAS
jgi:hypothetical protein